MEPFGWAILLLLTGIGFLVLELLIPSGGLLGLLATLSLLASIVVGFRDSTKLGAIMLCVNVVVIPSLLVIAVKVWPHTPIGRLVLLKTPGNPNEVLPEKHLALQALIGQRGVSRNAMLPSGTILVGQQIYDAVGEGGPIDAGQPVEVVDVRTNRLIVRVPDATPNVEPLASDDVLSRPIDSLGIDGLEDPLE